jgi:hypothetical protein
MRLISFYGVAESRDEPSDSPHPSPLPEGEGTRLLAPFSLGRRVGDEGNSDLNSAMPISFCRIFTARAAHCSIDNAAIMVDSVESCLATSPKFVLKRHILPKIPSMTW